MLVYQRVSSVSSLSSVGIRRRLQRLNPVVVLVAGAGNLNPVKRGWEIQSPWRFIRKNTWNYSWIIFQHNAWIWLHDIIFHNITPTFRLFAPEESSP